MIFSSILHGKEITPPFEQSKESCPSGLEVLSENKFSLATAIHDETDDLVCGHVDEKLRRDERDPKKNNTSNVIKACLAGVLRGFLKNLLDKATGFFDAARALGHVLGGVGRFGSKAFAMAKALWQGGITNVMNEFFSDGGGGFFNNIKKKFNEAYDLIKDKVASSAFTVTHCYSPVAKSHLACQAISYIGFEVFGGYLFSSLRTASFAASQASNATRTQKLLSGLTPFFKGVQKADRFVNSFLPRKLKKLLLSKTGLTDVAVGLTKRYRKYRNRFNVLIGRYRRTGTSFSRFRGFTKSGELLFKRYNQVNERISMQQKLVDALQKKLASVASMGDRILESDLRKELTDEIINLEKYYEQASTIGQRFDNLIDLAETGSSLVRNGIKSQVFSNGVRF